MPDPLALLMVFGPGLALVGAVLAARRLSSRLRARRAPHQPEPRPAPAPPSEPYHSLGQRITVAALLAREEPEHPLARHATRSPAA